MIYKTKQWHSYTPEIFKASLCIAIALAIIVLNYTSARFPTDPVPYMVSPIEPMQMIPKTVHVESKKVPPPPKPKIELVNMLPDEDEQEFVEDTPEVEDQVVDTGAAVDDYAVPETTVEKAAKVAPVIRDEEGGDEVVSRAERMPVFGSCDVGASEIERRACTEKAMLDFIYDKLKYPQLAKDNEIQGTVVVEFVVEKTGEVSRVKILRGLPGGCSNAVLQVMKQLEDFYPGKQNGRPVAVVYRVPIKFKLM